MILPPPLRCSVRGSTRIGPWYEPQDPAAVPTRRREEDAEGDPQYYYAFSEVKVVEGERWRSLFTRD